MEVQISDSSLILNSTQYCRSRYQKNSSCAIFVLKLFFFFFAEIDCLGLKQLENHGVQFFPDFEPIIWALNEDHAHFMRFDTVNIYKVILLDRTINLPCVLLFRCRL